ncbi:hypothetical protein SAMN05421642_111172 [Rhodococcoides kyotonense]|uniref:Peptidase MA superfamily protein n=2 Tax=Rhodococcoides kyotonense TaxID=398843 RepID=A0A239KWE9_9NOCA|nr:hypothetical protein SAMN05421642_111172 [Rhodococcus kyotonensis]
MGILAACGAPEADIAPSGTPDPPTNPYEEQRRDGVEQLLDRWAAAVRSNDVEALKDVVDPDAPPQFLDEQIARAGNLAAVPLSDWGYELVDDPETPVPSDVASPLDAADVWAPSVVLRYAIDGADEVPTRRPVSLLVAERGGEWRIVSDADIPGIDRHTWRGPWDFGPVTTTPVSSAGGTSVVVAHPEQSALAGALADELPAAVDAVTRFWGDGWRRTAVVFVTASSEEFAAAVGTSAAGRDVAAVSVSDTVSADRPVSGQRIVFGPAASERLTEFTTRSVLRHELTHVAARSTTVDGSPMWMLEGFADYSGYRDSAAPFDRLAPTLSRVVAAGGPPTVLPADEDFTAGGTRSTLAYESAWSVSVFVAERFGEDALRSLYEHMANGPKTESDVDRVLTDVLGTGGDDFVRQWGAWVATQSR